MEQLPGGFHLADDRVALEASMMAIEWVDLCGTPGEFWSYSGPTGR